MRALLVAVTLAAVVLAAAEAPALMCRTKRGQLVVRNECRAKKKEMPLPFAEVGLQGPQGAPGAAGAAGGPAIRLVDEQGAEVGPVVYADEFPGTFGGIDMYVLVRHDAIGGAALVAVDGDGQAVGEVSYTSSDCTGGGLVDRQTLIPVAQVIGDAVFRPVSPAGTVMVASTETGDQSLGCTSLTPRGGCCRTQTPVARTTLATTATTSLSALGLTPPFHVGAP